MRLVRVIMARQSRCRDEEGGAVLAMTAFLTVVIITIAAFAVDLGLQRSAIRDMQSLADAAAMDAARKLPSCDNGMLTTAANQSKQRHGTVIGDDEPLQAFAGHLNSAGEFVAGSRAGVCDAVRVTSVTTVARVFATGDGDAVRSAVGTRGTPEVCFSVGTRALTVDPGGTRVLGPILRRILDANLSVVGYDGLANLKSVQMPLLGLASALNVGSPQALLALPAVTLGDFLLATATALPQQGNAANVALLRTLAVDLQDVTLSMSDILALSTASSGGLNADVDALDLIAAAIVAANGTNSIAVQDFGITLPANLLNATLGLVVTEPPQVACGPVGTTARSAQVRLDVRTGVQTDAVASVELSLGVEVARGSATVGALTCGGAGGVTSVTMNPVTTAAVGLGGNGGSGTAGAKVRLLPRHYNSVLGSVLTGLNALLLPLLGEIVLDVGLAANVGSRTFDRYTSYPEPGLPPTQVFGGGVELSLDTTTVRLSPESSGLVGLLGNLLNPVVNALTNNIVRPLVNNLLTNVLRQTVTPVLRLLGIQLGITEVTMLGRPSCNAVQLVETTQG